MRARESAPGSPIGESGFWLDAFYDLVFVASISQVSHALSRDISLTGIEDFLLLFTTAWWVWIGGVWIGGTVQAGWFNISATAFRLITFLQMLPVAAMASAAEGGLHERSGRFALAFAAARLLGGVLWALVPRRHPWARPAIRRLILGCVLSSALFVASLLVPPPARFGVWGGGLAIDLLVPLDPGLRRAMPQIDTGWLADRLGLFVLIVLGEAVFGVIRGLAEQREVRLRAALVGTLGMALIFGLWWLYFDLVAPRKVKRHFWPARAWVYLHLPLVMAITALSATVVRVEIFDEKILPSLLRWLYCGAVCVAALSMTSMQGALQPAVGPGAGRRARATRLLALAGVGAGGLAVAGVHLGPLRMMALLLVLVCIPLARETWGRPGRFARSAAPRAAGP